MSTALTLILLLAVLLAPFGLVATLAAVSHRNGHLRMHFDQFRFAAPLVGPLFEDNADARRVGHDLDAIRTRFEQSPSWPSPGVLGERR
ncbi:hypothetical protein [Mycolicibacterium confluentis]|uniref:Uncharacterized protein n=1 Tax=Mycolicibacterium confluentis TaxID=28047 RepID=A0A7I7XQV7_9MYCO|nr:hypothetical protein [Mycolicibacterium confluentis]MCV7322414.1 hypothetical protein [Mycolicibacterium confluentis]ORV22433.1 hypothetical protein AWB99_25940 [Mycolicibacterium confluentis]BBZ31463.1 hypothetical protein MCNF_00680 [Mycolicibacterium confluentis]